MTQSRFEHQFPDRIVRALTAIRSDQSTLIAQLVQFISSLSLPVPALPFPTFCLTTCWPLTFRFGYPDAKWRGHLIVMHRAARQK